MMRIAACQYKFSEEDKTNDLAKLETLILSAKKQGAQLILFPEYIGIQSGLSSCKNDKDLFASMQTGLHHYLAALQQFATAHEIYIQSGTTLVQVAPDQYVNRAYLFSPNGQSGYQDKLHLTEYEKNSGLLLTGNKQAVFTTPLATIGIAICYDSEFPEVVRALVHAGATLILVPTYTTTLAGYYRVHLSSRARAIENQCYVAMASMVGPITMGIEGAEETIGAAGIYGPADVEFSADGIVTQGALNQYDIIFADLFMDRISFVRENGHVLNFKDSFSVNGMNVEKIGL